MNQETISLRIDKSLKEQMRKYVHINWSAILRKALVDEVKKIHSINKERALRALKSADEIRKSGIFKSERTGAEIIREWRDKRK